MEAKIGDDIILIGTAHVSDKSVAEVKAAIEKYKPAVVGVELDEARYKVLQDKAQAWKNLPLTKLIKGRNSYFFMAQLFLSNMQKKLGKATGVEPGAEMLAAAEAAKANNAQLAFVDRDITITLQRAWRKMRFWERAKILWEIMKLVAPDDEEEMEVDLDELMKEDAISMMMKELQSFAPTVAEVLIHERDEYITKKVLDLSNNSKGPVLAVVGAGHLEGIKKNIEKARKGKRELKSFKDLETIPKPGFSWAMSLTGAITGLLIGLFLGQILFPRFLEGLDWGYIMMWHPVYRGVIAVRLAVLVFGLAGMGIWFLGAGAGGMKAVGYSVPFIFVFMLIFLGLDNRWDQLKSVLVVWILLHGIFAMIGAIIAWGHPLSWVAAFLAAPWTSATHIAAAGWVAGAVELYIRKPTNNDLMELFSGTYETVREMLRNKVFKVLAVTALVNLGSMLGTFVSAWWIASNICI
jgi:pheromone shutdown-related protein TraB